MEVRECWRWGRTDHTQYNCTATKDKLGAPLAIGDKNRFRRVRIGALEEDEGGDREVGTGILEFDLCHVDEDPIPDPWARKEEYRWEDFGKGPPTPAPGLFLGELRLTPRKRMSRMTTRSMRITWPSCRIGLTEF